MLHSKIAGYNRAAARAARLEEGWREFPFLGGHERICGLQINLLTLRMFLQLCHARSPYLVGGRPGPQHALQFVWRLSPNYAPTNNEARAQLAEFITANWNARKWHRAIIRFVDRMLLDKPPSSGSGSSQSDVSFAVAVIHQIASAYGWDADRILDTPMPALFQYMRQIKRDRLAARGENLPVFNPFREKFTKKIIERHRAERKKKANSPPAAPAAREPEFTEKTEK